MEIIADSRLRNSGLTILIAVGCLIALEFAKEYVKKKENIQPGWLTLLLIGINMGRFLSLFSALCIILVIYGISITALLSSLGIAAMVIGLALQDTLKDVFMGIRLMTDHFFAVGEWLEYEGSYGMVVNFNLTTTKLGGMDHSITSICNRKLTQVKRVRKSMCLTVPTPPEYPREQTLQMLEQCCKRVVEQLAPVDRCTIQGIEREDEFAVTYQLLLYSEIGDIPHWEAYALIREQMEECGVSVPYVHNRLAFVANTPQ